MTDLLFVELYSKPPCFLPPGEQLQETTRTFSWRGTVTKGTLKWAEPEEDSAEYLRDKLKPALNHLPLTSGGGWEM